MARSAPSVSRSALALALVASLAATAAGCEIPTSVVVTVRNGAGLEPPEVIRIRVFDGRGTAHDFVSYVGPKPANDGRIGTFVVFPRKQGGDLSLRLHIQGLRGGMVISDGSGRAKLTADDQIAAAVTLASPQNRDRDGDNVPDDIDNCADVANGSQDDADVDGRGDACDTPGPSPDAGGMDALAADVSPDTVESTDAADTRRVR
jgi:hypothetical protein